jgi:hypothetical protein
VRSLAEVGWFSGHRAALYWLGVLYRKPKLLEAEAKGFGWKQKLNVGAKLYLHGLPYLVLLTFALRLLIFELAHAPIEERYFGQGFWVHLMVVVGSHFIGLFAGLYCGLFIGLYCGLFCRIAEWRKVGLVVALILGLIFGLASGLTIGLDSGLVVGLAIELVVGFVVGLFTGLADRLAFGLAIGVWLVFMFGLGGVLNGLVIGLAVPAAFYFLVLLRLYYWPLFWWLTWPIPLGHLYRCHPVAWDDRCRIPYPGFARLLLDYAARERRAGEAEIERLINEYAAQRRAALWVRTILLARDTGKIARFSELEVLVARLPEGKRGYLAQTERLRAMVMELVALATRVEANEAPALRALDAAELGLRVRDFRDQVAGFSEPLAAEFREASLHWQELAEAMKTAARTEAEHAPQTQVFRAGDKVVDRAREAFVLRGAVLQELQQQLLLATGCPGLVLYGRRRVGKSSVLCNVDGFLPDNIRSCVLSLQDPRAFTDLAGLCREVHAAIGLALSKGLNAARPMVTPKIDPPQTLDALYKYLDQTNRVLAQRQERLILALDEYENLDRKIGDGVFPIDLLHFLRESLQSHREIIWILAGSHEIDELSHADWTSYLVSARTVEVPMFTQAETRMLLTDPMKHAPRREELRQDRPRFEPEFWGPEGIDAIHEQAGGWPHLVQLLAEALLDQVNLRGAAKVDAEIYGESLDKAVVRGHNVFAQLLYSECQNDAEKQYVLGFKRADNQPPPVDDNIARSLRCRQLITDNGNEWQLRVPLMQRWLQQRG